MDMSTPNEITSSVLVDLFHEYHKQLPLLCLCLSSFRLVLPSDTRRDHPRVHVSSFTSPHVSGPRHPSSRDVFCRCGGVGAGWVCWCFIRTPCLPFFLRPLYRCWSLPTPPPRLSSLSFADEVQRRPSVRVCRRTVTRPGHTY